MAAPLSMLAVCVVLLSIFPGSRGWDNDDLELFDLVEEVNRNFYELMGVEQTATSAEIRRAYRRLSLQLHPDKNKEEDAEVKFRQLVAVHEVLRDSEKREKYHSILEHGLPDWRQPVYYYRKVRKMGLLEMSILLISIITIGQYFVAWASYLEKKFEIEEVLSSRIKKERKSKKSKQTSNEEEINEMIEEEISALNKPRIKDLLPFKVAYLSVHMLVSLPENCRTMKLYYYERQEALRLKQEEEEAEALEKTVEVVKKPKKKKIIELPQYSEIASNSETPVVYQEITSSEVTEVKQTVPKKKGDWDDEELSLLIKAVAKFPGGSSRRWEKIAEFVGRPVNQVVLKAKEVNESSGVHVSTAFQGTTGTDIQAKASRNGKCLTDDTMTQRFDIDAEIITDSEVRRRKPVQDGLLKTKQKGPGHKNSTMVAPSAGDIKNESQVWNQNQQKILEWALSQYPKTSPVRWEKIAEHIPGKTKEQCIVRVKYLAELVKKKKQSQEAS